MKNKQFSKKLVLNKTTIARLGHFQMRDLYGRNADVVYCLTDPEPSCNLETIIEPDCVTKEPICPNTKPEQCPGDITKSIPPYCIC